MQLALNTTLTKISFQQRRQEIRDLLENLGFWGVSKTALAQRYGVSRLTIHKDIEHIVKQSKEKDLQEISFALDLAFKKALNELMLILNTQQEPNIRIKAINALTTLISRYTQMLESYGIKGPTKEEKQEFIVRWRDPVETFIKEHEKRVERNKNFESS